MVRWLANSTVGTMFPMVGVEMKTTSNLVMMIKEGKSHYYGLPKDWNDMDCVILWYEICIF